MSDTTPAVVIRDALFACGLDQPGRVEVPEIMASLKAAGYAIVELPRADIVQDTYLSWAFNDAGEREHVTWPAGDDDEIAVSGIGSYTPAEARAFAVALLAAVSATEQTAKAEL